MSPILFVVCGILFFDHATGLQRRCFQCRSRGELGSCRDPFGYNVTQAEDEAGVKVVQCASGWCGKLMQGGDAFKQDDYAVATQRMCLQRGPSDSEERCAYTMWNHKKVYMCFCNGDVCNAATKTMSLQYIIGITLLLTCFNFVWQY